MNGFLHNPIFAGFILALLFTLIAIQQNKKLLCLFIVIVAVLAWMEITHHGDALNGLARLIFDSIRN